ncbi:MAG: hypothetical protein ACR2NC_03805 [Thermodesulfobacteriota bacterium]
MKKTAELISKIIELRKETKIDPFNFAMHKYFTWESSIEAQLQENAQYLYPKIIEIITEVLEENMSKEELTKLAELQIELTNKYGDKLETMEKTIHKRVEDYIELYNEAVNRIMTEEDENEENETEWTKNN